MRYFWRYVYITYQKSNGYLECNSIKSGNGLGNEVHTWFAGVTGVTHSCTRSKYFNSGPLVVSRIVQLVVSIRVSFFCGAMVDGAWQNIQLRVFPGFRMILEIFVVFFPSSTGISCQIIWRVCISCWRLEFRGRCCCQFQKGCRFGVVDIQVRCM